MGDPNLPHVVKTFGIPDLNLQGFQLKYPPNPLSRANQLEKIP
jgi:hypothetical protein